MLLRRRREIGKMRWYDLDFESPIIEVPVPKT
jgi:hypothetical protein